MGKIHILVLMTLIILTINAYGEPTIDELLEEINPDSVAYTMQSLQDFGTRYAMAPNRNAVVRWIKNRFVEVGVEDVVLDSFYFSGIWHKNVITTIPGTDYPDEYVMIGGHHDSMNNYGDPMLVAPGANDNASGIACAIELARVMNVLEFEPKRTLQFITFAAEEQYLRGSTYDANKAVSNGKNIVLLLNNDEISYNIQNPGEWSVNVIYYDGFEYLADFSQQLSLRHTSLQTQLAPEFFNQNDSFSYWLNGYPTICHYSNDYFPYLHTENDVIENCDINFCVEIIKLNCALMTHTSEMSIFIDDLEFLDVGDGNAIQLNWDYEEEEDFDYYNVYIGVESENYYETYTTTELEYTINNLEENQEYFFGISAVNESGFESLISEISGISLEIPRPPANLTAMPTPTAIELTWNPNPEIDLAGYRIYRSDTEGEIGEELNADLLSQPYFIDDDLESGIYYYYTIYAEDMDGNVGDASNMVTSRLLSLDQGILIVDATTNGNGTFMFPTDDECDDYYSQLLSNFQTDSYDLQEEGIMRLCDVGAYSTVIWYMDTIADNPLIFESEQILAQYLDIGGQILISGYQPSLLFSENSNYPMEFTSGEFIYDYLKISSSDMGNIARFNTAIQQAEFGSIFTDLGKTPEAMNHHLIRIESITSADDACSIYSYGSQYDDETPFGQMNGLPITSAYFGEDYKSVVVTFPLYYMDTEQSKNFITSLLTNYFNETTSISDENITLIPSQPKLLQNYPNPFNPTTTIAFTIPHSGGNARGVELQIYDISGKLIKALINSPQKPGYHSVVWDGKDEDDMDVPSGLYLYQIETKNFKETKQMLLIK